MALLDRRRIKTTSVDLVRFSWIDDSSRSEILAEIRQRETRQQPLGEHELRARPQAIRDAGRRHTNATIWIGVLPRTLSFLEAHETAMEIIQSLLPLVSQKLDVSFREAVVERLGNSRPPLFAPDQAHSPLADLKQRLAVSLGQCIALRRAQKEGTLGLFFHTGSELCAVTARHVLFDSRHNEQVYGYHGQLHNPGQARGLDELI